MSFNTETNSNTMIDPRRPSSPTSDAITTLTTGRAMILRSNSSSCSEWYAHFTEADWEALRHRAQTAMKSLFSIPPRPRDGRSYQMPPRPPALIHQEGTAAHPDAAATQATECGLPSCFLCPFCKDVIVGAVTLDCGCQTNVCAACWEYHSVSQAGMHRQGLQQFAQELDFVIVPCLRQDETITTCPCCHQSVHDPLACHALDVAIAQIMVQYAHFKSVWDSYAQRVDRWRDELTRRQAENEPLDTYCQEQRMALLIQEEETFWKQRRRQQRRAPAISGGLVGMAVAVAASVGLKYLLAHTSRAIQNGRL